MDGLPAPGDRDRPLPGQLTDAEAFHGIRPVDRSLLRTATLEAARSLLGALLVREAVPDGPGRRIGRIVELEAYIGQDDLASHARMGPTPRNRVMFGPAGHAYVYLVYGMHHCLNVVTEDAPAPAALLVRAVEPLHGLAAMREARGLAGGPAARVPEHRLAAGPGLVGSAFSVDRSLNGVDLCSADAPLWIAAPPPTFTEPVVASGPRVGIGYAGEPWVSVPWRLWVAGSRSLSRGAR